LSASFTGFFIEWHGENFRRVGDWTPGSNRFLANAF
jgi:hypothetical protein